MVGVVALLAVGACKVENEPDQTTTSVPGTETMPTSCLEADIHDVPIHCVAVDLSDSEQLADFVHACEGLKKSTALTRHYSVGTSCPDMRLSGCSYPEGTRGVHGVRTDWYYELPIPECSSDGEKVAGDVPEKQAGPSDLGMEAAGPCADWCVGTCLSERCLERFVVPKTGQPSSLAFDDESLYWLEDDGGSPALRTRPLVGGKPHDLQTVLTSRLLVSNGFIFWSEASAFAPGVVFSLPAGGGEPVRIAEAWSPSALRLAGDDLYFVSWGGYDSIQDVPIDAAIMRVPSAGGDLTTLGTFEAAQKREMVLDEEQAYFFDGEMSLASMPLGGGEPSELTAVAFGSYLTLHAGELFFVQSGQAISAIAVGGGDVRQVSSRVGTDGFAVAESGVYFATSGGEIMRVPVAGGEPESIAVEQKHPSAVAVHGRAVYWVVEPDVPSSEFSRGAIMKLSPVD